MSDDIPNTDIGSVYETLKKNSDTFNRYVGRYVGKSPYTDIFDFFVNIDAYKDNNLAFTNGSNYYFTLNHSGIKLISSLSEFKIMMRSTIKDLQKYGMSHLLHIHKLKYRSGGKLPPPAILQHLPNGLVVNACFDSGSGPGAVFGTSVTHEKSMNHEILCSVANTVIDPGPSGSSCNINIERGFTGFTGYKPTLDSTFFKKFGYSNIQRFEDTGALTFKLQLNPELTTTPITITDGSTTYLAGNANNNKYFSSNNAKKYECDIRTTMKKLGDDLQVFISCLYKIKLIAAGISTILVMMLTCDLGVSFMSLMLGVDCVFKDKDEVQQDPGQQKLGNSWYIKSLLGAPEPNFEEEIQKTRAYVISEYEDFMLIIGEIISKLEPTYMEDITIQIKGDTAYNKQQLVDTKTFFQTIYSDLNEIRTGIATMTVAQDSTSIDELKKCVPNKFILRHRLDPNIYAFTMAQKYTRGDNIPHELNNGTTGKTKATPFVQQFKTLTRRILATIKRGGGKAVPMEDFFIDSPVLVVYTPYDADKEVADDRRQYIGNVAVELFNQKNSNTFLVLNKIAGYVQDDFYYNGLSYVDDALDGYADYEQIPNYVDEFIGMINTWMQEEMQKGISVPISMNTGLKRGTVYDTNLDYDRELGKENKLSMNTGLKRGTDYDTNLDYDRELGKENKLSRIGVFGGKKNKKTLTKQTKKYNKQTKKKRNYPKNVRKKFKNNKTKK
jgi:hypothetical protein